MAVLSQLPVLAAVILLCGIAWHDIHEFKIRNKAVLALVALYMVHILLTRFEGIGGDLIAAGLLFFIGFVMWMTKGMAAGDTKLMIPIGLFVGYMALPIFGVLLLLVSIALFVAILLADKGKGQGPITVRLRRMKQDGKVPYALPLVFAAIPSIIMGQIGPT